MTLENKYIMDQIQHTNKGQRFKLLPGGELPMKQYASHYPDLHWTCPPRKPFAYRCICFGQMPAISVDKYVSLFSIVTMFELKNLLRAPYGGQTLGKAVPAHPQPPSLLPCGPWSVCKTLLPYHYCLTTKEKHWVVEFIRHTSLSW